LKAAAVAGVSMAGLRTARAGAVGADSDPKTVALDQQNAATVLAFWGAWAARDEAAIMSFFDCNAIYHNIPVAPIVGLDAIKTSVEGFLQIFTKINIVTVSMASANGVVHTQRMDNFMVVNGNTVALPVAGTLAIKNGLITEWNDYFDLATFESQSGVTLS
jgi:limonene-1,2-epoxide hydrolase